MAPEDEQNPGPDKGKISKEGAWNARQLVGNVFFAIAVIY